MAATLAVVVLLVVRAAAAAPADEEPVVVNLAGDVSYPDGWPRVAQVDTRKEALFEQVRPILDSADLNFANLECPLTRARLSAHQPAGQRWAMTCHPKRLGYLLAAGFNLLSLANNHAADAGLQGLQDTIAHLRQARTDGHALWWAGIGRDSIEALRPASFVVKGVRVALLSVSGHVVPPQVADLRDRRLAEAVRGASASHEVVIVSSHAGGEYAHVPSPQLAAAYRQLIDAGADLVVGHHAHVVQGVERHRDGVIFHGLGNFSFASITDRPASAGVRLLSMMARTTFRRGKLDTVELIPLYADNRAGWLLNDELLQARFATPQLLSGSFADAALAAFERHSAAVPNGGSTNLLRVGARAFVELGRPLTDEQRRRSLRAQAREYQAVVDSGAGPVAVSASCSDVQQRCLSMR